MAFSAFFRILFDGRLAAAWYRFSSSPAAASTGARSAEVGASAPDAGMGTGASPDAALLLLSLLQGEGRFVDFVQQDIASFPDADVGAVARVVHSGCRKVLRAHLQIEPIRAESEGQPVTLEAGFDPSRVKLTGNVGAQSRVQGVLRHRGWQASDVHLPLLVDPAGSRVLCPAEVEM
jgi:hypothetical protein